MSLFNCRRDDLARYTGLQMACVMIGGVGEQKELFVATVPQTQDELVPEFIPAVTNKVGRLLLPMMTPPTMLEMVELHRNVPAFVLYDTTGRVHQIVADDCLFLVLMRLWDEPRLTTTTVAIDSFSHEQHRLLTSDREIPLPLQMPENTPAQFRHWTAAGEYEVTFDQYGRVFSIQRHDTDIKLGPLWDTRF